MIYKEAINYLYTQLPMFHREGKTAYKANLDNIVNLTKALGNPERKFKTIHIAGTNGKGSVCHMLASVLQHANYKTGLFTSPHLLDFRERIKINGKMVPEEYIISFVENHKLLFETFEPSFFEMTAAMAFDYFAREEIDIAVIETGLGGRLDATNVVIPIVSAITNISYDHTDILGNTLEAIAGEKAGIIKPGIPVVIGESHPETRQTFIQKAQQNNSKLVFAEDIYSVQKSKYSASDNQLIFVKKAGFENPIQYKLDLLGKYQQKNIVTTLAILDDICEAGIKIEEKAIERGLAYTARTTELNGRWQILGHSPLIIADTGHNEEGLKNVVKQLMETPCKNLHVIFGMVKDKDIDKVLSILSKNAGYYFTKAAIPRALDENILFMKAKEAGLRGSPFPSVKEAFEAAKKNAGKNDCIFIGGSTFVVAEVL